MITLDNEDLANKVRGFATQGDTLILTSGTLDEDERQALHLQGIDTITDGTGETTTRGAPALTHLNGGHVYSLGNNPVRLDSGEPAVLTDDDGLILRLDVRITSRSDDDDIIEIDSSSGIELTDGVNFGSGVWADGREIGSLEWPSRPSLVQIRFLDGVAPEIVQRVIRALTYRHAAGTLDQSVEIEVKVTDRGGRSSSYTVLVALPEGGNAAPEDVRLNNTTTVSIPENASFIGFLSASDDAAQPADITYAFDTSASRGGDANGMFVIDNVTKELKPAPGKTLNYESAFDRLFTVYVKAIDGNGSASASQAITIEISNVNEAPRFDRQATYTIPVYTYSDDAGIFFPNFFDPDDDHVTVSIAPGGDPSGKFEVVNGELRLKQDASLDYDALPADQKFYSVTLRISDGALFEDQTWILQLYPFTSYEGRVLEGSISRDVLKGNNGIDNIWGYDGHDRLFGFGGNDQLSGGDGNDYLYGGLGQDFLIGGIGKDKFVFDTKPTKANLDRIADFVPKEDKVLLDNAVYKTLGKGTISKPGKIKKDMFVFGSKAKDKNDVLILDKKYVLWYDADGSGKGAKVAVADFDKKIAYADLLVI